MELHEWIADRLTKKGHGARVALASRLSIDPAQITRLANGTRKVALREIPVLRDFFGEDPPMPEGEPTIIPIHEAERNGREEPQSAMGGLGARRRIPGSILEIDAAPGAGEGMVGEIVNFSIGSETYSAHPVNAEWVIPPTTLGPRFGMVSSSSLVMLVRGDSMEPTFRSGDPVGVDLRVKSFEGDGIYVFSEPGEAPQIKRLQKVPLSEPRKVRIISDNKTYETDIVELGSIIIHGRVKLTVLPK